MNYPCDCLDFPVSWTFWRDHCRTVHGYDPGSNEPEEKTDLLELADRIDNLEAISAQPGQIPKHYYDELKQIKGQVNNLQNKLNEHLDRKVSKYKKYE